MNRDFRQVALEARRASTIIATGGGRRPKPVVTKQPNFHNPAGVEQKIAQASCLRSAVTLYFATVLVQYHIEGDTL